MTSSLISKMPPFPRWALRRIVFLFPVLCLLTAAFYATENALFQMRARQTQGEVVRVYQRAGENMFERGRTLYSPVFRYRWSDGTFTQASTGQAFARKFEIGERHTILFDPHTRNDVRLNAFEQSWKLPLVLSLLGLLTLALAWLAWAKLIRPRIAMERKRRLFSWP